jgi:hypothetical protein
MLDISQPPPKSPATKVTAKQIEKGCPTAIEVEALGYRIAAHLKKVRDYEAKAHEKAGVELRKAEDNWTTVTQLLAEAKAKCNAGGFKAFKEKYCPNLSRSRIYELLEIGTGKKTLEESRAAKRESVAKSRRGKKVSTTNDVVDKSAVEPSPAAIGKVSVTESAEVSLEQRRAEHAALDLSPEEKAKVEYEEGLKAGDEAGASGLGFAIEREWLEAERAFEALTAHTVAQLAQAIPPAKVALVTEIAGYFTALAAKLTDRSGDIAGATVNGSGHVIPDDLDIPEILRRGGATS